MTHLVQTTYIMIALVCLLAVIWGADRERKGALIFGVVSGVNIFLANNSGYATDGLLIFTAIACLTGFVALCWKSSHLWPLWAAAAQGMAIMGHVLRLTNPRITATTADIIQLISIYIVLFSLLAGTVYAARHRSQKDNSPNIG